MQENLAEQTGDRKNLTIVKRRKNDHHGSDRQGHSALIYAQESHDPETTMGQTTMGQAAKGTVH